ncbi:MAG TPA: endonuclease/exonuclease/phosphatase family protein [Pyrinomonadaceae bacterium]|jgi:endonuclease/exonuclease/phosphatase family metal-dependent hydrolase|nr:endonuclease/exonuclease/phosphatase family protein [Pyrinomonadaceae bacterium]
MISSPRLVVASYNIRYARGPYLISGGLRRKIGLMNLARRPEHVGQQISTAAKVFTEGTLLPRVDVLALQEADKRTKRSGGHHIAEELATQMNVHWAHEPARIPRGLPPAKRQWWLDFEEPIDLNDSGDTGVALLSRVPMAEVTRIDLPWHECPWRPRLAIAATISVGTQQLRLFNAHIDPHAAINGQLAQLEVVAAQAKTTSLPTVILGDFNTLSRQKCIDTRQYLESQGYTTPYPTGTATWRGGGLRMHADWIFVRGLRIESWGVARPLNVSDHWPIWAEIAF